LAPLFMQSDDHPAVLIRPMVQADRDAVADVVVSAGNFNQAEIDCAFELIDIYLNDKNQKDYRIVVAENSDSKVHAYACWGPVPLTRGAFDLYWIATHPDCRKQGYGRALMAYVESDVQKDKGRLLLIETSSKESYESTTGFYRSLDYRETSRIRDFYDIGDDLLVFAKRFSR
jgi:ribosomal protein S18 acetylase RimI-like enzyme